jgi:hypothetical protein
MQNAILKQQQPDPRPLEEDVGEAASASVIPPGIEEVQAASTQRTARIHELLNNMDEDGAALANFEPLDHPVLQQRIDRTGGGGDLVRKQSEMEASALQIPGSNLRHGAETPFHPSYTSTPASNYHQLYEHAPPTVYRSTLPTASPPSDRWMEKMNYVIYLLEQQQNEKTNHITEEFVLYTFLGVFVIFVVDAFSRGGKYVR